MCRITFSLGRSFAAIYERRPLPRSLAMYIVKYEELRYVVAEHTADESLRLVLVDILGYS